MVRVAAPEIDGAAIDAALRLLALPTELERWHSECYPTAGVDEAAAALRAWESLAAVLEPLLVSERPAYEYSWHPLPALIRASHFLWHWWELPAAAALIERVAELSSTVKTADGVFIQPPAQLAGELRGDAFGEHPYGDPRFIHLAWYYLAEIAEAEGRSAQALAWYERFIAAEPGFAPLADFELDEWYYYAKRYPPNTVEACRRAGRCAEAIGREGRARVLYDFGLSLRRGRFSPLPERAALRRREGAEREALADELAYLDGLLAGYEASLRSLDLFARYLALARRCARAGFQCLRGQAGLRAVEALRRTHSWREVGAPGGVAFLQFTPPDEALAELRGLAADAAGDEALYESCRRALADAAVARALKHRDNRESLAEIEAELERLHSAGRWPALRGRCAALTAELERLRDEAETPFRREPPGSFDDLAALAELYAEAALAS